MLLCNGVTTIFASKVFLAKRVRRRVLFTAVQDKYVLYFGWKEVQGQ